MAAEVAFHLNVNVSKEGVEENAVIDFVSSESNSICFQFEWQLETETLISWYHLMDT